MTKTKPDVIYYVGPFGVKHLHMREAWYSLDALPEKFKVRVRVMDAGANSEGKFFVPDFGYRSVAFDRQEAHAVVWYLFPKEEWDAWLQE